MPKLKLSPVEKRREIIGAWQRYHDIPDEKAAEKLGMSIATMYRRRRAGDWTIEELHRAIMAFKIPADAALELLIVGCFSMERHMERERERKRRGIA